MTLIHIVRQNKKTIIVLVSAIIILTTAILLITFLSQKFIRGSVVANGYACSNIGRQILEKGGTAADAAIAALFCEGAVMPQSMGLGGGFLLTFYQHSTREAWSLNSREVAPLKATQDMYGDNGNTAKFGGKAIAVPGELLGYWSLYNKFGKGVSWKELIQPTIDLCENGIYVSEYLATKLKNNHQKINSDPELSATFINPNTNSTYNNGDYFKRPKLAKTLRVIAEEGGTALNNGSLTKSLVQDIQSVDGIITEEDMNIYKPVWTRPAEATFFNDQKLFSSPLPGSGQILIFILNILDGFLDATKLYSITNYQRIVESFKYAYGQRTKLGDKHDAQTQQILTNLMSKDFAKHTRTMIYDNETYDSVLHYGANAGIVNDQGTAHISVLAPNGDAVAVTSTINGVFGAYYASPSTGIILNNQMDDFSSPGFHNLYNLPPSPANFIQPGKRPLSSMCPTIVLDKNGEVVMVIGASGGSKITTTVAQIIIKTLWFGLDLKTAMQSSRLHHQLIPNVIMFEESFNIQHKSIVDGLKKIGHNITFSPPDEGFAAAVAISSGQKQVYGESDIRRPGSTSFIFGY